MATIQINNTTRIWMKFRTMGNVEYAPQTNELISGGMYGSQDAGTLIVVQAFDGEYTGDYMAADGFPKYWVPALTRYEPQTRTHGGGIGAYRNYQNDARVAEIVQMLRAHLA